MLSVENSTSAASDQLSSLSADTTRAAPSKSEIVQQQQEHVFKSKLPDIPISNHLPLHTYCFENLSEYPDRRCLIAGNKSYTYAETHLISRRVASGLSNLMSIASNDVVMVLLQNCPEFVFTFIGASMIGAVTTTANPFCTAKEIFKQFDASRSKIIITHSQYVDKLRLVPSMIHQIYLL